MSTKYANSRRKSSKLRSTCDNKDEAKGIKLIVDDEDRLLVTAGQDKVYGESDKEVVLTARTNEKPTK